MRQRIIAILFCLNAVTVLSADVFVHIDSIIVLGNKKTRREIVIRELPFREGDSILIEVLHTELRAAERWLMNSGLFNSARVFFHNWEGAANRIQLQVELEESWYFYPVPLFELADRNFNVWWVDHRRSFDRVNYGLDFLYRNATGRSDRLNISFKQGYSEMLSLQYNLPYLNAAKTLGVSMHHFYSRNREVNYATIGNKQAFFRLEDDFSITRFVSNFAMVYRPDLAKYYRVSLGYIQNEISAKVEESLGVDLFLNGDTVQRYLSLGVSYTADYRDARPYPLEGTYFWVEAKKDGLGIFKDRNALTLWGDYQRYLPFGESPFNLALSAKGKLSLIRGQQPYNDYRAIGYQRNTLRGYEYYVIDGLDMVLFKSSLRIKLWEDEVRFGKMVPIAAFRKVPFKFLLSLNSDWGYANDPWNTFQNSFNRQFLWGRGIGLDTVILFNFVLRVEASMNHVGERGFFIHFNTNL
jgi:outer membrane protein assembly factor BamA